MPPAPNPQSPRPTKKWRWLKRTLLVFAVFAALLIVFYQPIIFGLAKFAAHKVGPSQGLQIDLDIHGSIFSSLTIENLRISPTSPNSIERCNIGLLEASYSLPALIRNGLSSDFIRSVTLHDADIIIDPSKSPPAPPKKKEPFQLPPLPLPQRLSLRNLNFLLRAAPKEVAEAQGNAAASSSAVPAPAAPAVAAATTGVVGEGLLVRKLNLDLEPDRPGAFEVSELRIPSGPDLENVFARTSYRDRDLRIIDLELAPEIKVNLLQFDASGLGREALKIALDADTFRGKTRADIQLHGLGKPPHTNVALSVNGLSLASLHDFLKMPSALDGAIETTSVQFEGYAESPHTWVGAIDGHVANLIVGDAHVDAIDWKARIKDGAARLETAQAVQGANKIALVAGANLPEKMEDLPQSVGKGTLTISAPDISQLPVKNTVPLGGSFQVGGDFTLGDGKIGANLKGHLQSLTAPQQGAAVESVDFSVELSKLLPADATAPPVAPGAPPSPPKPFFEGLHSKVAATVGAVQLSEYRIDGLKLAVAINEAAVRLEDFSLERGENRLAVSAGYHLPKDFARWKDEPLDAHLELAAPHVSEFSADQAAAPLHGKVSADGGVTLKGGVYGGAFNLSAAGLEAKGAKVQNADVRIAIADNHATIKSGTIILDPKNTISLQGSADLQSPFAFDGGANVALTDLAGFNALLAANGVNQKLGGAVQLSAQGHGDQNSAQGAVTLNAQNLEAAGAKVEAIDGQIDIAKNLAVIKRLQVRYDTKNTIDLGGQAAIQAPFDYQANLNVNLGDLQSFEPILRASAAKAPPTASEKATALVEGSAKVKEVNAPAAKGKAAKSAPAAAPTPAPAPTAPVEPKLAGAVTLQWQASGNLAKDPAALRFSGGGKLTARKVEFNAIGPVEADVAGEYSPTAINFPTLTVNSNGLSLGATIGLANNLLRIDHISLRDGATELLGGYAQAPIDLKNASGPTGPVSDVDGIDINIASKPIDLESIFKQLNKGQPAPAAGVLDLSILAHGRLSKLTADLKAGAHKIRLPQKPTLAPADADVALNFHDDRLSLETTVRQPQLQTLTVRGNVPLILSKVLASHELDKTAPIALTVQLPRTDLGFVSKIAPAVRFIEGNASVDIRAGGTIGKPTVAGSANLNVPAVRMQDVTLPSVRNLQTAIAFTDKAVRIDRFSAEIGGGKLTVGGGVNLANLQAPALNIAIAAKEVLAARDDNLTARVNADVKITGPLSAATVAGTVGVTKSRYLKDIDIVPINLPGKPPPSPPAPADSEPSVSITSAPVKDWKFDLALRTDDPFLIRGNLARGQAVVDLRLRGTGLKPLLDGNVQVQNLVASLPFSRLTIDNGNINFTPDQPLNPVIDMTGASTIRNYLVSVYITGRAHDPKITFSSDPPLAQEQIVSLLATGATTDELAGNAEGLAGKATLLALQDLYRRTFKKKSSSRAEEPKETLADRLTLDVGSTDPNTGKQEVTAGYKVTDQVQVSGQLGIEGDINARVGYIVRFR